MSVPIDIGIDQADRANNDQCIPVDAGPGCTPVTPPSSSSGGGSFSLAWMLALSGLLVMRRRRYDSV